MDKSTSRDTNYAYVINFKE